MGEGYEVIINVERRTKFKRNQGLVFEDGKPVIEPVQNDNGLIFWVRCRFTGLDRDVYLSDMQDGPFPTYVGFTIEDANRIAHDWARFFSQKFSVEVAYCQIAKAAIKEAVEREKDDGS